MTTYLGRSCSFGLPRVPFVNCFQFMYLDISLLVLRAGCGIWLYQFLIIVYLFTILNGSVWFYFGIISIDLISLDILNFPIYSKLKSNYRHERQIRRILYSLDKDIQCCKSALVSKSKCSFVNRLTYHTIRHWNLFHMIREYRQHRDMSRAMRKCVLRHMRTTKAQISLRIRAVWSAPLLFAA